MCSCDFKLLVVSFGISQNIHFSFFQLMTCFHLCSRDSGLVVMGFVIGQEVTPFFFSFFQPITSLKLCSRDLAKSLHPQLFIDDLHALHLCFLRYFGLVFAGFVISIQHFITASVTHKGHKRFSTANKHFEAIQIGLHLTLAIESEL